MGYKPISILLKEIELKERVENEDLQKMSTKSLNKKHVNNQPTNAEDVSKVSGKSTYRDALMRSA